MEELVKSYPKIKKSRVANIFIILPSNASNDGARISNKKKKNKN